MGESLISHKFAEIVEGTCCKSSILGGEGWCKENG